MSGKIFTAAHDGCWPVEGKIGKSLGSGVAAWFWEGERPREPKLTWEATEIRARGDARPPWQDVGQDDRMLATVILPEAIPNARRGVGCARAARREGTRPAIPLSPSRASG